MNDKHILRLVVFLLNIFFFTLGCQNQNAHDKKSEIQDPPKQQAGVHRTQPNVLPINDIRKEKSDTLEKQRIIYFTDLVDQKKQFTIRNEAFKEQVKNNPSFLSYMKIYHDRIKSIRQHPMGGEIDNTISFGNMHISPSTILKFSIGIFTDGREDFASDGVVFKVALTDHAGRHLLFEQSVTTFDTWIDCVVDVSGYSGKQVSIVLVTEPGGHTNYDWANWGSPRLIDPVLEREHMTKEIASARRYDSIINRYRDRQLQDSEDRVDRGWFVNAINTDILLSDVSVNSVIRTELYVIEKVNETDDEEVTIQFFNEKGEVLTSSVYSITEPFQVISDEYMIKNRKPHKIRISLNSDHASVVFIKEPVQYTLRNPGQGENPSNVILISLDTLRADRLSCYGYQRKTSPNIDALAAESFVFTNAYSNSNWTLPSHTSMLTSLYPSQHQIVLKLWQAHGTFNFYPPDWPYYYIPEAFKEAKYLTIAFTGGGFVDSRYGFNKGMDYHVEDVKELNPAQLDIFSRLIETHKHIPFFVFFHTYEIHDYLKKKPSYHKYVQNSIPEDDIPLFDRILLQADHALKESKYDKHKFLSKARIQYIEDLYDGAIAHTDNWLGTLWDRLKQMGIYDSSWIILTSDHGEGFGELHDHDRTASWHHATSLYDDQIKIPLIIKPPKTMMLKGSESRNIDRFVQTIDIPPTLLSLLKMKPHEQFEGESLIPFLTGTAPSSEEISFSDDIQNRQFAVIYKNYKLISRTLTQRLLIGEFIYELYHVENDRNEKVNLLGMEQASKYSPIYHELRQFLDAHIKDVLSATCPDTRSSIPVTPALEREDVEIDREHLQRLRDLGYL